MKTKIFAMMLMLSGVTCCDAFGNGLLSRMLGRGGCGAPSSCCDTGSSCGAGLHVSLDVSLHLPRLRRGGGCGGGCDTGCDAGVVSNGCGCNAPVVGGCDSGCGGSCAGGLLSGFNGFGLRNRFGGCGGGCDTGCDSGCGAPVSTGCGCDTGCDSGCDPCGRAGFLSRLRGRLASFGGGCGCDTGCDSGCGAAPVSTGCGCDNGCGAAPVSAGCGCDNGCGAAPACRQPRQICIRVPNLGLLDRVRSLGNRGCGGCDAGCGGCDSGCGAPVVSGGCGCNGGSVINAAPIQAAPIEAAPQGASTRTTTPTVDPNAFIIQGAKYSNN
ncbi:MAG: hypothetical protein R3C03_20255 [Pirellulaceae bacterium]